ncbi:SYF2-domain-containing protein [Jaminaea rosea]|uniref:Pre-mRNA-splicing factor SYF2 n=1 Tax=Jaminaea rosea TaxID=1569628 RepID=A0A316UHM5_9BASI|nr:SYF2-domain-containing protein [Jaminaea rosea]PWN24796.1 SYF2-domain-containing protein [Jaminaea rosea]
MPPRKTRAAKKVDKQDAAETSEAAASSLPPAAASSVKGKAKEQDDADEVEQHAEQHDGDEEQGHGEPVDAPAASSSSTSTTTMEDRKARLLSLKQRLSASSQANRKDLVLDKAPAHAPGSSTRKNPGKAHKLAKAAATLDKRDAEESGKDWERVRNWGYSMEDQERWEEKLREKEEKRDKGLIDANGLAARSYARGVEGMKPDLKAYQAESRGKEKGRDARGAEGSSALVVRDAATGAVVPSSASSPSGSLSYGSHRPSDNAVDRVIGHLNMEADARSKRSRKRPAGEDEGEVTYINEKNAHFNRKINRFFDEHTTEIRENFERGTA